MRKNWWLIVICAALGVGGGVLLNVRTEPLYESQVTFYVSTPTDAAGGNAYVANQYALAKINSYIAVLSSDALATLVVDAQSLPLTPAEVSGRISAKSDLNTVLITVTATDPSLDQSLKIATGVAEQFGPLIDQLDNRTSQNGVQGSAVKLNVVSGPTANPDPVSPKKRTNIALGFAVGLILGAGLAMLRGLSDNTLRTADALQSFTQLPALGAIPVEPAARKKSSILIGDQLRSVRAEAYRQLRTNLQFMDLENPVQVLVVASSVAAEGKSTTAANLAIVTAETGRRVVLIEADMRRPRVAEYLGLERSIGLSNVLVGQVAVTDVLQTWGTDGLLVLPCGSLPPNPSELLGSHQMVDLIEELRGMCDLVVIDTPPLLPVTDAAVASTRADGVLVVVRYGKTTRNQLDTTLQSLDAVDARILGCVLSMVPRKRSNSGYQYYYEDKPKKRGAASASSGEVPALVAPARTRDVEAAALVVEPAPEPANQPVDDAASPNRHADDGDLDGATGAGGAEEQRPAADTTIDSGSHNPR